MSYEKRTTHPEIERCGLLNCLPAPTVSIRGEVLMPYHNGCNLYPDCTTCPFPDCIKCDDTLGNAIEFERKNGLKPWQIRKKYKIPRWRYTRAVNFLGGIS